MKKNRFIFFPSCNLIFFLSSLSFPLSLSLFALLFFFLFFLKAFSHTSSLDEEDEEDLSAGGTSGPPNQLTCTLCPGQEFACLSDYLSHIRCHSRSFYGGSLGAISGGSGRGHVQPGGVGMRGGASKRPVVTCGVCGNQFSRRTSMKRHCLNVHKMEEAQFQAMMDKKGEA